MGKQRTHFLILEQRFSWKQIIPLMAVILEDSLNKCFFVLLSWPLFKLHILVYFVPYFSTSRFTLAEHLRRVRAYLVYLTLLSVHRNHVNFGYKTSLLARITFKTRIMVTYFSFCWLYYQWLHGTFIACCFSNFGFCF